MRYGFRFTLAAVALVGASVAFAAPPASKGSALSNKAELLPSGVKVETLREGTGQSPSASDRVTVNYRGTLVNGTEFDSSYSRGQPASFPLRGVIRCWTEGVQKMKVGGKAKLTCPADTAYGSRATGGIPANSTLIFEIELLGVN